MFAQTALLAHQLPLLGCISGLPNVLSHACASLLNLGTLHFCQVIQQRDEAVEVVCCQNSHPVSPEASVKDAFLPNFVYPCYKLPVLLQIHVVHVTLLCPDVRSVAVLPRHTQVFSNRKGKVQVVPPATQKYVTLFALSFSHLLQCLCNLADRSLLGSCHEVICKCKLELLL